MDNGLLSQQWNWSDMEELLQCPVCMELPVGAVPLCEQGHHICVPCRRQLRECPLCKSGFLENGRNWVMEQLLSHITQIKTCMTLSNILSPAPPSIPLPVASPPRLEVPPVQSRGLFPCAFCSNSFPVCRMRLHLNAIHEQLYKEFDSTVTLNKVSSNFDVEFRVAAGTSTQAFTVKRLGLFFIDMVVGTSSYYFFLRMVATEEGANNVSYFFKITNICANYVSKMYSCRQSTRSIITKKRCLAVEKNAIKTSIQIKRTGIIPLNIKVIRNIEAPLEAPPSTASEDSLIL